ncbi:MAG: hypothetical protein KJ847_00780, partial [Firmicutes bacterium]|nr:hypothetical protein [Bacillota bacterium]
MAKTKRIIEWMFYAFIISSLLIPAASVNKILFVGILFVYVLQLVGSRKKMKTIAPFVILMIYIYGYLKSFS